jgi:hypothetical protein
LCCRNFTVFGWLVFVVETLLAVLLLTGTAVRLAALIGIGQSLAIGLSVAEAPNEWPWAYAMMAGIHLVLLLAPSAQYAAVDAVRAAARTGNAPPIARRLLGGWGVVLAVLAVLAALSIYVQIGRTEVWLGGTPTTAAVFVCAVVVAVGARPVRTASAQNQGG